MTNLIGKIRSLQQEIRSLELRADILYNDLNKIVNQSNGRTGDSMRKKQTGHGRIVQQY